jgi:Domain of unknown function (DUF397)
VNISVQADRGGASYTQPPAGQRRDELMPAAQVIACMNLTVRAEVALTTTCEGGRDSKHLTGPALSFSLSAFRAFLTRSRF